MHTKQTIVPRTKLDFDLQGDIPQYWFGGDPFKTRFFDAMSTMFPEGERFFINCVRDFRDQVTDPTLQQEIKDFIRQEGQHGVIHNQFNDRLRAQGIDVDAIERFERKFFDGYLRRWIPKKHTLALTAASEHMTAIMAHSFFAKKEVLESARRLPCQVDSSKLEATGLKILGMNARGGTSPRDSCGRYSL